MKRPVIAVVGILSVAVACSSAQASPAQGHGRGHEKHAAGKVAPGEREVVLPTGTLLRLELTAPITSETAKREDQVRAVVREPVVVERVVVLPRGTRVIGYVADAERSGRVKGRARLAMRFDRLLIDHDEYVVRTDTVERIAEATKGEDATKIGLGAGAGAAIGAILNGTSGATKGAVLGGAAGTGAVLATRGDEVRLDAGEELDAHLTSPLAVRVPTR